MQNPVRKVKPRQDDMSQKVVGSNLCTGKKIYRMKTLNIVPSPPMNAHLFAFNDFVSQMKVLFLALRFGTSQILRDKMRAWL